MARVKIRYLVEKRQGDHALFYSQPSRSLRAQGWFPRRLARGTNNYLDAIKEAESLNGEVDAWRKNQLVALPPQESTLPWLIRRYEQEPSFKELAISTQRGYGQCLRIIEQWSREAANPPLKTLTRRAVKEFHRAMHDRRHKANAVMRVLRLLLNFAIDEGLIDRNPAERLRLVGTPPRTAVWSDNDIQAFVNTALDADRPSLALAVLLGAHLGQREGDILRLSWTQYDRAEIELRQQKTGKFLRVPLTEVLKTALDSAPRVSTQIVVNVRSQGLRSLLLPM